MLPRLGSSHQEARRHGHKEPDWAGGPRYVTSESSREWSVDREQHSRGRRPSRGRAFDVYVGDPTGPGQHGGGSGRPYAERGEWCGEARVATGHRDGGSRQHSGARRDTFGHSPSRSMYFSDGDGDIGADRRGDHRPDRARRDDGHGRTYDRRGDHRGRDESRRDHGRNYDRSGGTVGSVDRYVDDARGHRDYGRGRSAGPERGDGAPWSEADLRSALGPKCASKVGPLQQLLH